MSKESIGSPPVAELVLIAMIAFDVAVVPVLYKYITGTLVLAAVLYVSFVLVIVKPVLVVPFLNITLCNVSVYVYPVIYP